MPAILLLALVAIACDRHEPRQTAQEPVAPVLAGAPRVEVSRDGFRPSRVQLGSERRVTFRRTTEETCATTIVVPELSLEKQLPLNEDVVVELPPSVRGELGLQCGVGMYKGSVVIQ